MSFQADALSVRPRCRPRPRASLPGIQPCMCEQSGIGVSTMQELIWQVDMVSECFSGLLDASD